jgi:hypothetical protein
MNYEAAMVAFVELADQARAKKQLFPCDKFLILAGAAACRAGCLEVAARCRELVVRHNAAHLLTRFESLPDALRDAEFQTFLKQLEKFCSPERAEHLLQRIEIDPDARAETRGLNAPEYVMALLEEF